MSNCLPFVILLDRIVYHLKKIDVTYGSKMKELERKNLGHLNISRYNLDASSNIEHIVPRSYISNTKDVYV